MTGEENTPDINDRSAVPAPKDQANNDDSVLAENISSLDNMNKNETFAQNCSPHFIVIDSKPAGAVYVRQNTPTVSISDASFYS